MQDNEGQNTKLMGRLWRSTRRAFLSAAQRFGQNWAELVLFALVFQAAQTVLLAPAGHWALARIVSGSGDVVLGNEEIALFLLSARGAIGLLVILLALFTVDVAQRVGMLWIGARALHGKDGTAHEALMRTVVLAPRLLRLTGHQLLRILLWIGPVLAFAGAVFYAVVADHDLFYLVSVRPPPFWYGVGGLSVLGLLGLIFLVRLRIVWVYAPALLLFEECAPRTALRRSRDMARGHFREIAAPLLLWWLGVTVAGSAMAAALLWIGERATSGAGSLDATLAIAAGLVAAHVLLTGFLVFATWAGEAMITLHLYRRERTETIVSAPETSRRKKHSRLFPLAIAGALVMLGIVTARIVAGLADVERDVSVTAHRGDSVSAPENSLSAIRAAIDAGADYAEIDVQEIADGSIVVFHDTDLKRITGSPKKIWEVDLDEVRALDAGSWFSEEFRDERIPTLKEAIAVARGRIRLNIELKFHGREKRFVESVLQILRTEKFEADCVVSSLHLEGLKEVRRRAPDLVIGFIVFEAVGDLTKLDVEFLSLRAAIATPGLVDRARRVGKTVHVWTINTDSEMAYFVDLSVANIITDKPALLRRVLNERNSLDDQEKLLLALHHWWAR